MTAGADLQSAIAFLQSWEPDGPWLLTAIKPDSREIDTRRFVDPDNMRAWLVRHDGHRNIYFSVNRPRAHVAGRAKKSDIAQLVALHVDLDPPKIPGLDLVDAQAAIRAKLEEASPTPSVIIASGGGYQGFWLLDEPVDIAGAEDIERVEAYNIALEHQLGADHCHNIDRIMRVPGTTNLPDARKRALGRHPVAAELVRFDLDRRYRLEDFEPAAKANGGGNGHASGANGNGNGAASTYDPGPWLSDLIRLGHDPEQPDRWSGDRSKAVFAVACGLVKAGWRDDQIAAVLVDPGNGISAHVLDQKEPQKYALRQASQARQASGAGDLGARRQTYRWQGRDFVREVDGIARDPQGAVLRKTPAGYTIEEPPAPEAFALGEWDFGAANIVACELPPRGWLLGNWLCRQFVSALIADGAAGKTATRLACALALATGREDLLGEHVFERVPVLFVCFEDGEAELKRRICAAMLHHRISNADIEGFLFVRAITSSEMKLAIATDYNTTERGPLGAALDTAITRRNIGAVFLDPLVKTHAVNENSNKDMDLVIEVLAELAIRNDIALDTPHHVSKGTAEPGNADRGRGASAVKDAGRLIYTLTGMSDEVATSLGVDDDARRDLVRIDPAKVNIVRRAGETKWLRLVGVPLGNTWDPRYPNGDNVQTVERWTPPDAFEGIAKTKIAQIFDELRTGPCEGEFYSPDARATYWGGDVVAANTGQTKEQAKRVLHAWRSNQVLLDEEYYSKRRRQKVPRISVNETKASAILGWLYRPPKNDPERGGSDP